MSSPSVALRRLLSFFFFFFNDTATTEIYTLSLHDALPISSCGTSTAPLRRWEAWSYIAREFRARRVLRPTSPPSDRKSTRLNSSHSQISYAVFCLKKKKNSADNSSALHRELPDSIARSTAL